MRLYKTDGGARQRVSPQHVDDRVPAHKHTGIEQKQTEYRTPCGGPERQRRSVIPGLKRA